MSLLVLRNVRAIDPAEGLDAVVDIAVDGETFLCVGPGSAERLGSAPRGRIIDARGLWALPGLIDMHTHLREPGDEHKEDIETGLAAAAAGGFATICAMANTRPTNDSRAITEAMRARSRELGGTRLHPIGAISLGLRGEALAPLSELRDAGCVAFSDDGRCVTSSTLMRDALQLGRELDAPIIQHAEDHGLTAGAQMHEGEASAKLGLVGWPRVAEDTIVARDALLAEYTHARYHLAHASTEGAVRMVREAKSRGIAVTAEVTPHHLLLTDAALLGYDTSCKVNPPLREERDVRALRRALADGTIDCIATDHAPHSSLEKDVPFEKAAPGMIGLELCIPLLLSLVRSGELPLARLVDALTAAPARVLGLPAPRLREGERADLVLVDPNALARIDVAKLRSKSRNTPFSGRDVQGKVLLTLVSGRVAHDEVPEMPPRNA